MIQKKQISKRKNRYKPVYKKFLNLKSNPLNNHKFNNLNIKRKKEKSYSNIKSILVELLFKLRQLNPNDIPKSVLIQKEIKKNVHRVKYMTVYVTRLKKKKWRPFFRLEKKKNFFTRKFKPYTFNSYSASKFASQGNSLKKKFRNDLRAKKIFNYSYGGFSKKYLKNHMSKIYRPKETQNPTQICAEFFESRLDSVLYKSKFCYSIKNARQLIVHKHITVNNKIEKNKSYILKHGDLVTVNSKSIKIIKANINKQLIEIPNFMMWPIVPEYLIVNYNTLEIVFGDIKFYNFSTSFNHDYDLSSVIVSNYRH